MQQSAQVLGEQKQNIKSLQAQVASFLKNPHSTISSSMAGSRPHSRRGESVSAIKKASARLKIDQRQLSRAGSSTSVRARASSRGLEGTVQTKDMEDTLFTPLEQKYQSGRVAPKHLSERKELSEQLELVNESPMSTSRAQRQVIFRREASSKKVYTETDSTSGMKYSRSEASLLKQMAQDLSSSMRTGQQPSSSLSLLKPTLKRSLYSKKHQSYLPHAH